MKKNNVLYFFNLLLLLLLLLLFSGYMVRDVAIILNNSTLFKYYADLLVDIFFLILGILSFLFIDISEQFFKHGFIINFFKLITNSNKIYMGDNSVNNIDLKKGIYHMCENTGSKGSSSSESTYTKEQEFARFLGEKSEITQTFKENIKILKDLENAKKLKKQFSDDKNI